MTEQLLVRCACGAFEARGSLAQVTADVRRHGEDVHNMSVTDEQVSAMAVPADGPDDGLDDPASSPAGG